MRRRGSTASRANFFSFQDIITSVIGVLLVITLFMSIFIGTNIGPLFDEKDTEHMRLQLEELLAKINGLQKEYSESLAANSSESVDEDALRSQIVELESEISLALQQLDQAKSALTDVEGMELGSAVAAELAHLKATLAELKQKSAELEADDEASRTRMNELANTVAQLENQLLAEQQKKNQLDLIHDRTQTTKEPIVVLVSASGLKIMRLDKPAPVEISGRFGLEGKLKKALQDYNARNQYLVFYFKPDAVGLFDTLIDASKAAGFDVGYDLTGQSADINLMGAKDTP